MPTVSPISIASPDAHTGAADALREHVVRLGQSGVDHAGTLHVLRTHYTVGQRALYAASLTNVPRGVRQDRGRHRFADASAVTATRAADMVGVSATNIQEAKRLRRLATPDVMEAVEAGAISLYAAGHIVKTYSKDQQAGVVARMIAHKGAADKAPPGSVKPRGPQRLPRKPLVEIFTRLVRGLVNTCDVLSLYIERSGDCPAADRTHWVQQLDTVLATLRRFRRRLQTEGKP